MITKYKLKKYENNLSNILEAANINTINYGLNWYNDFYLWCSELSLIYNKSTFDIAQIFSALSPRNKLEKNKIDTITVLNAINKGLQPNQVKVSTFHNNKNKAFNIALNKDSINKDSSKDLFILPKCRQFKQ